MKRVWWGTLTILLCVITPLQTQALETSPSPSTTNKVNGPLLITGYSFSGHSLRYVQLYNSSPEILSVDGWVVSVEYGVQRHTNVTMAGVVAPGKYITVANSAYLPSATFTFVDQTVATDPPIGTITLQPPDDKNFNNEVATPVITSSTQRVPGTPATFYFNRNISISTGNYLTTFTAFVPDSSYRVTSDQLYEPPQSPLLQVVEVYPDPLNCSPLDILPLCKDYIKLQNVSQAPIDLSQFRLRAGVHGQSASSTNTASLSGILQSGQYASFPISLSASGAWVWIQDRYGTTDYDTTMIGYPSSSGRTGEAWSYDESLADWRWTTTPRPGNYPNQFPASVAINLCEGIVINEIAANVASEDQFIEVANLSSASVELAGCIVQTNRSTTKSHVFGSGTLAPGELTTIYIKDTALTLTKTTNGTVYVLSSDGKNEVSSASYERLSENTSWAFIGDTWVETYSQSPGAGNRWMEFPACGVGYFRNTESGLCNKISVPDTLADCGKGKYRNQETNRCRAIDTAATLATCLAGQYRNQETNRCRSMASTSSLLMPCGAGKIRNPETNRCRSSTNAGSLVPCTVNQERNPETNRCRKKASTSIADFPVEAIAQTSEATLGWWAFGGVGILAAGYAGWEWRREATGAIKKVVQFVAVRF